MAKKLVNKRLIINTIMDSDAIMDSEIGIREENCTELDMINKVNNVDSITSCINLTDEVKIIFENLVIENFRHQNYQSNCLEELNKIWLGENFLVASPKLDIKKETERFDNDCRAYILLNIYLMEKVTFTQHTILLKVMGILWIILVESVQFMIIKISMSRNYLDIFIISMRKYKDSTIILNTISEYI